MLPGGKQTSGQLCHTSCTFGRSTWDTCGFRDVRHIHGLHGIWIRHDSCAESPELRLVLLPESIGVHHGHLGRMILSNLGEGMVG